MKKLISIIFALIFSQTVFAAEAFHVFGLSAGTSEFYAISEDYTVYPQDWNFYLGITEDYNLVFNKGFTVAFGAGTNIGLSPTGLMSPSNYTAGLKLNAKVGWTYENDYFMGQIFLVPVEAAANFFIKVPEGIFSGNIRTGVLGRILFGSEMKFGLEAGAALVPMGIHFSEPYISANSFDFKLGLIMKL